MKLSDLTRVPIKKIEELAKLAPDADKTKTPPTPTIGQGKKSSPRGSTKAGLGAVSVEKYLTHYGVEFNVKVQGNKTLYRLSVCLFDPAHTKNEAAIVQSDNGLITYQCFHNSCSGHRWSDARAKISGADSLAPFCEGYDPDKHKQHAVPEEAAQFLVAEGKKRPRFVPAALANYLEAEFKPVICEGKDFGNLFYRYDDTGVWKFLPEAAVGQAAFLALGDFATPARINQPVELLQHQTYLPPEKLEADPMLLNLKNGMFDVRKMQLTPHDPKYNSRVQLPVNYSPDAKCPDWIAALEGIFADDEAKVEVIQQFAGYCLYPKIIFPCALFQIGRGRNGKGTVQKIIQSMLGKENVCHISLLRMEDKFGPVELRHKLLNACGETAARPLDPTQFKAICAGDAVQAEVKYGSDIVFDPIAKHMISMNEFPGIKDKTDAFYRRVIVLEYHQSFEGDADDTGLTDRLMSEQDGVFLWALEGLKVVLENNRILVPESVEQGKKRFRASSNSALSFMEECCVLGEHAGGGINSVAPPVLYKTYKAWCDDSAVPLKKRVGKQKFYEHVLTNCKGVIKKRQPGGTKDLFFGLGIEPDLEFEIPE